MPDEGFLRRWSRLKATGGEPAEAPARPVPAGPAAAPPTPPTPPTSSVARQAGAAGTAPAREAPTLDDAARLTPDSDFSAFVRQDVDKAVQRLALKKLFADPHFHVMDGLDMYMDDYNKPSPMSAAMFAALEHAKSALRPSEPHRPQVAVDAVDAAAAPALEAAATDPAAGAQPAPVPDEPAAVTAGDEASSDHAVRHGDTRLLVQQNTDDTDDTDDTDAPPACAQAGLYQQSLQGQA